ncbi:hypothetical protein KCU64_g17585, partial [Aureobasidium melanogenum]
MYPDQFSSSFFKLFDWIMGTSSAFKNKRIATTGTRGAFGAAFKKKKQLESDGVSQIAALRYGVDFDDKSVSTDGIGKLADTDVLILAHGLRYGDVMKANYETSRRLVEVFAQSQARTPSRPNTSKDIAIRCRIYSHRRFAHVCDHTLAIAIAIAVTVAVAIALALAICLPICPFYTASRRPVAP